jgi:CTD small phosphatase-like protein 2
MGGAGAGGSSVAVRSHVAAAAVVAAPAVAAAAVADPYADAGDDGEGEADEFEVEEFNPYLFIKLLPPYHAVVARPPRAVLPVKPRRSPDVSLVLDLDETLVHCSVDPIPDADLTFPVNFNGINYQVYVRKRPHLDRFLRHAADQFEVTIFTASQQVYAERLLNLLDPSGILIHHRLYRDSCLNVDGNYLKDLNVLGRDLRKTVLVDNSPHAFGYQVDNGIPIESWFDDRADTELLKLLGFLETLHGTEDVRPSIRAKFAVHRLVETAR